MISVTVKCDRCKEHTDIKNIKPMDDPSQPSPVKVESCRKCANSFNVAFRRQLMHPNSQRAGYLDLEGCTAFDLLPSYFQPTCSECSTPFPAPGLLAVRGDASMASCRECHRKMNFKISEVKFMVVGYHIKESLHRGKRYARIWVSWPVKNFLAADGVSIMARVIDGSDSVVVPKSFRATNATMLKQIIQTNTAIE
ncbi:hypothetical protein F66182_13494 [Fusarium sp. NRRL 66182]|nr:hypothetical protein F66182_13494 [Fusarium sp. NRRL 66182]